VSEPTRGVIPIRLTGHEPNQATVLGQGFGISGVSLDSSVYGGGGFYGSGTLVIGNLPYQPTTTYPPSPSWYDLDILSAQIAELRREVAELHAAIAAIPRASTITTLDSDRYQLRYPITVEVSHSDDRVSAHATEVEVYADAEDEYSALGELRTAIVEEYQYLREHESELAPTLARRLNRLRQLIVEQ
jgi:hypothetical protein